MGGKENSMEETMVENDVITRHNMEIPTNNNMGQSSSTTTNQDLSSSTLIDENRELQKDNFANKTKSRSNSTIIDNSNKQTTVDNNSHWYRMGKEMLDHAGITINGDKEWDIQVYNPEFYKRVMSEGSMGLGESFMDGWWECQRLDLFFYRVFVSDVEKKLPKNWTDIVRIASSRVFNHQTRKRSLTVAKEHYDLGNDLYNKMLDPAMQYSCGYWKDATNLEQAQQNKLRLICEKLQLKPGLRLLDIGCGWGGLAEFAARNYGVSVVGVTISVEQKKLAEDRCAGLDVQFILQDYRDINDQFDRIVSVGMFEHVGPKNYATFFKVASRNIKPDGLFLLHTIGANVTMSTVDPWINKYVFKGGVCPSIANISSTSEGLFVCEDLHNFGQDYDTTLLAWYHNFLAAYDELDHTKYSPRFKRMWTYYLNSCAAAFRARHIQLWQFLYSPKGIQGGFRVPR